MSTVKTTLIGIGKTLSGIGKWIGIALLVTSTAVAVVVVTRARFEAQAATQATFVVVVLLVFYLISLAPTVLGQFRDVLQRLDALQRLQKHTVDAHLTPDKLYRAATLVLADDTHLKEGASTIRHAILHGHIGGRIVPSRRSGAYKAFDEQFDSCIRNSGPGKWDIRQIYLVGTEERFNMVLGFLSSDAGQAEKGHWVRVFVPPFTQPHISPLIIGNSDAFLAFDDPSFYRVKAGLHLRGEPIVTLLKEHFDSLWNAPGAFEIRTATKLNETEIAKVRSALRRAHEGAGP